MRRETQLKKWPKVKQVFSVMSSNDSKFGSCVEPGQEFHSKINADKATKIRRRRRRFNKGRKANEGMTAAIILIAFIITAAGVAFVILTIGSTMQQQLGATGQQALQQASSAMQIVQH